MAQPARQEVRAQVGPYVLTEHIGQGGMAVVYKAKRQGAHGFEKQVVVKALLPALVQNQEFVDLFCAEARLSAQLQHPAIVQVQDFGVDGGVPFMVMEWLDGINVAQLMGALTATNKVPPVGIALGIATEVCHALGYAHSFLDPTGEKRQIIHCDVSPSNIMVCRDGTVKLLDFGVAKIAQPFDYDTSLTVKGKYAYMSPEQVNRLPIDRRADVFAAGIVLHELLTGRRLFAAQTELETLQRIDRVMVEPPSKTNPGVPPAIDAIVMKALKRDPGDRFDSGAEMAMALERVGRLASPRQHLAEYLAELFPDRFFVACESCGLKVVPGFVCKSCGTEAPVEISLVIDNTQEIPVMPPPVLQAEPFPKAPLPAGVPNSQRPLRRQRRRRSDKLRPYQMMAVGVVSAIVGLALGATWRRPVRVVVASSVAKPIEPPQRERELPSFPPLEIERAPEPAPSVQVESDDDVEVEREAEPEVRPVSAPPVDLPRAVVERARESSRKRKHRASPQTVRVEPKPAPVIASPVIAPSLAPVAKPAPKVKEGRLLDPFGGGR